MGQTERNQYLVVFESACFPSLCSSGTEREMFFSFISAQRLKKARKGKGDRGGGVRGFGEDRPLVQASPNGTHCLSDPLLLNYYY